MFSETIREQKTLHGHLMLAWQHLYNGLARPADYSIFAHFGTEIDLFAWTACWPTTIVVLAWLVFDQCSLPCGRARE